MKVTLLAYTQFNVIDAAIERFFDDLDWGPAYNVTDMDALGEFAGRACYQSWDRPNPATAMNHGYLANIIKQQHESVLEHASATFYVEGVSRSLTHELIRHRHLSFSELSQRFLDPTRGETVSPPAFIDGGNAEQELDVTMEFAQQAYNTIVGILDAKGLSRKQAREAARAVLPNATETKIVVTGNMRAWRDVIKKRHHVAADAEIQKLAKELLRQLKEIAPNSFQDIPDEPYGKDT